MFKNTLKFDFLTFEGSHDNKGGQMADCTKAMKPRN